jgi:hypothetical protein
VSLAKGLRLSCRCGQPLADLFTGGGLTSGKRLKVWQSKCCKNPACLTVYVQRDKNATRNMLYLVLYHVAGGWTKAMRPEEYKRLSQREQVS